MEDQMVDLADWVERPAPERKVLDGRYVRLEPFNAAAHGAQLYSAASLSDADDRFAYLPELAPQSLEKFQPWLEAAQASDDPLYFAVIDKRTDTVEGRQTLMRIDPANGVIETGHIFWGGRISRTPVTTEAFYLFARYIFDDLGYRRFEWKCNNANEPSKVAAIRFGMSPEGVFRQAAVVKGENRDTAWFSLIDKEWPPMRAAFEAWLDPANFDGDGQQIRKLQQLRESVDG
ncbi:MAG: GNAT family N-acetyltransferase [Rhizobiaceae bacterium]|nr:GNAT family N-acetyltransferase [Rhizobiaceae bacterium]